MSDWAEQVAAAEAGAERQQAMESEAESRFDAVHAEAEARGNVALALKSDEFREWMDVRRKTDEAWGHWATVMDAKPQSHD